MTDFACVRVVGGWATGRALEIWIEAAAVWMLPCSLATIVIG